jgi:hypothetical protein
MKEKALVAYRSGDIFDTYNLSSVKYSFVLWFNLESHVL